MKTKKPTTAPATTWAGGMNPITGDAGKKVNPPRQQPVSIDVDSLRVEPKMDPRHRRRAVTVTHKYDAMFGAKVKEGSAIVCAPSQRVTSALALAIKAWARRTGQECIVRTNSRCDDGNGRVEIVSLRPAKAALKAA